MAVDTSVGNYYRASIVDPSGNVSGTAYSIAVKGKPSNTTSRFTALTLFPSGSIIGSTNNNNDWFEFNGPSFGNSPCFYSGASQDQGAGVTSKSWIDTTTKYTTAWNSGSAAFHGSGTNTEHGQTNGVLSTGASSASVGCAVKTDKICIGAQMPADNTGNDVPYQTFIGSIAGAAFWQGVVLSDREQVALGIGVSPRLIRRQNLWSYLPMIASAFNAAYRSTIQTTGAPTFSRHPRQFGW